LRILKYHLHRFDALATRQARLSILPAKEDAAGGGLLQPGDELGERTFAAAAFADQPNELAGADAKVDLPHRRYATAAEKPVRNNELLRYVLHVEHRRYSALARSRRPRERQRRCLHCRDPVGVKARGDVITLQFLERRFAYRA
jgi:hypothetical protein